MTEQPEGLAEQIGTDPSADVSGETSGDGVGRESYHGYSVNDEDQPQSTGDSMVDGDRNLADPLDAGMSPPEQWSPGQGYGNTPLEESLGESMDQRLAQEVPEADPYEEAAELSVDAIEGRSEDEVTQVGEDRAGRLVEPDEGRMMDTEKDAIASDVGIDGAGASAEEAAMHVIEE